MNDQALLLLVERDERAVQTFRATLEVERRVRLAVAPNGDEALRMAREHRPDLIVLSHDSCGMNAFSLVQMLRQDATFEATVIVMIIERGANDMRFAGLTFGVDEYLTRPVEPAELLTKVNGTLRLKKTHDALRVERAELAALHESLKKRFDQLLDLMTGMLDMRVPGAVDRGKQIADLAKKVAGRFGVPAPLLPDLEIAARLHELGRVVATGVEAKTPSARGGADDWKYVMSTRAIISQVEGLEGAADLIGGIYENWDGSGHPDHVQLGQIPLRARILRVLIDLFADFAGSGKPDLPRLLDRLQDHAGTFYDPMVLVHLRAVLDGQGGEDPRGRRLVVPVAGLKPGMVLAEDLFTDSGLKLLSRNTRLTHETLEVILRRHAAEPLSHGAAVLRQGT